MTQHISSKGIQTRLFLNIIYWKRQKPSHKATCQRCNKSTTNWRFEKWLINTFKINTVCGSSKCITTHRQTNKSKHECRKTTAGWDKHQSSPCFNPVILSFSSILLTLPKSLKSFLDLDIKPPLNLLTKLNYLLLKMLFLLRTSVVTIYSFFFFL